MAVKNSETGVWLVVTDRGGYDEYLHAVFPGGQELAARQFAASQGFGDVAWEPFGEAPK